MEYVYRFAKPWKKKTLSKEEIQETLNKALKQYSATLSTILSPENKKRVRENLKKCMEDPKYHLDWMDPKILESLEEKAE